MATASTQQYHKSIAQQWSSGNTTNSNDTYQISVNQVNFGSSFSSPNRDTGPETCNHRTRDGSRCDFPNPPFDDGKCLWHTSEQCFRPTDDGSSCELTGSRDDGACHVHTKGCNELSHNALEKACFHGMKFPYRMLGLHPDTKRTSHGKFDIQPQIAAEVAARVGKGYLEALGEEYNREESHEYYVENIVDKVVDDQLLMDKIKDALNFGGNISDLTDNGVELDIFKKGIKQAWKQVNKKEHHTDGARTAIAAAEHFLDIKVEIES